MLLKITRLLGVFEKHTKAHFRSLNQRTINLMAGAFLTAPLLLGSGNPAHSQATQFNFTNSTFVFTVSGNPNTQMFVTNQGEETQVACLDASVGNNVSSLDGFFVILFILIATQEVVSAGVSDVECNFPADPLAEKFYQKQAFSAIKQSVPGYGNPDAFGQLNIPDQRPGQLQQLLAIVNKFRDRCPTLTEVTNVLASHGAAIQGLINNTGIFPSPEDINQGADVFAGVSLGISTSLLVKLSELSARCETVALAAAALDLFGPGGFLGFYTDPAKQHSDAFTALGALNKDKAPQNRTNLPALPFVDDKEETKISVRSRNLSHQLLLSERRYALAAEGKKLPGLLNNNNFDAWVGGNITLLEDGRDAVDQDGNTYAVSGGASYAFKGGNFSIGLVGQFSRTELEGAGGIFNTNAYTIGGFFQAALNDKYRLTGLSAYTRANLDVLFNPVTNPLNGDVTANAFTNQLTLARTLTAGAYQFTPNLNITHVLIDQNSFILSNGAAVGSLSGNRVTFSGGGSIARSFFVENLNLSFTTSLGANLFGAINELDEVLGVGGIVEDESSFGVSVSPGIAVSNTKGISASFNATYVGTNTNQHRTSFNGQIKIPF